jgi:hypothetical protein
MAPAPWIFKKRGQMRTIVKLAVILQTIVVIPLFGRDCSVSKPFQVSSPQALAGVLQVPNHIPLPGIQVELLSGTKVIQRLRTNNQGKYDFGMVHAGGYRIHVEYSGGAFCAPRVSCTRQRCIVDPVLRLNPKDIVKIQ